MRISFPSTIMDSTSGEAAEGGPPTVVEAAEGRLHNLVDEKLIRIPNQRHFFNCPNWKH